MTPALKLTAAEAALAAAITDHKRTQAELLAAQRASRPDEHLAAQAEHRARNLVAIALTNRNKRRREAGLA